jgi:hypothetical protein
MTRGPFINSHLLLSVRCIRLPVVCTAFFENATLTEQLYEILTSVNIDSFECFVDAVNAEPPDFCHANVTELWSLAAQFGLIRLPPPDGGP